MGLLMNTIWHLDLSGGPPQAKCHWFLRSAPERSFALDGWVARRPSISVKKRKSVVDHHVGVDRLITRCTAAQITMNLRLGRYKSIFDGNGPVHAFFESIDPDVIFSLWVIEYWHDVLTQWGWRFEKLLHYQDLVDTTAATYPFPINDELFELSWVFDPYFQALSRGDLDGKDCEVYYRVIWECFERIQKYMNGSGGRVFVDLSYDVIERHDGWGIFRAHGSLSRMKIVADGCYAFMLIRERRDGCHTVTLQRTSVEQDQFPIGKMYGPLNLAESRPEQWGGNDIVGGSPVINGTWQPIPQVSQIAQEVIATSKNGKKRSRH